MLSKLWELVLCVWPQGLHGAADWQLLAGHVPATRAAQLTICKREAGRG
jgi:hypothetical protein